MESQNNVGRRNQQFVCDGIQIGAQRSFLVQSAREQTIQSVGETCNDKNCHSPTVSFVMNSDDEDRQKRQPQKRELIGNGKYSAVHKFVRQSKDIFVQANCSK